MMHGIGKPDKDVNCLNQPHFIWPELRVIAYLFVAVFNYLFLLVFLA